MFTPLTPDELQSFMEAHHIAGRLIRDIGETPTVAHAAAALQVAPERIVKTLLFLVEGLEGKGSQPHPLVVISNGEGRVDKKVLADHFGVGKKRVKLAPAEVVAELLGYPAGGVPPFGHRTQLPVFVDTAVAALADGDNGIIYGGSGDDRTMLEITVTELLRVVPARLLPLNP